MGKIIIIGAGPGGYETAIEAAKAGEEVVLIDDGPLGGVCVSEGCIPTKTYAHYAELKLQADRALARGIILSTPEFDFKAIRQRKEEVVEQLQAGIARLLRHKLITLVSGRARFKGSRTVAVEGPVTISCGGKEELVNGAEFTADALIVATGSVSASLPISGADLALTSKEVLDLEELPESAVVIGGGVIGLELASILSAFGSKVTILEYAPRILPRFDAELSKRLKLLLAARGISIVTSAQVSGIVPQERGQLADSAADGEGSARLSVTYLLNEVRQSVSSDLVLMAVGRRPNVESLNFSDIGVDFTRKGVTVDDNMQTSVSGVYAIGDITGGMMLAHTATAQGHRALCHILGVQDETDLNLVPAAVFTIPEAATVGLSEEEAKSGGISVKCCKAQFGAVGRAVAMDEADGFCKIVTDASNGRILGAHIIGAHSSDLIHEIAALMRKGPSTVDDLRTLIHAHPTLSEIFRLAVG